MSGPGERIAVPYETMAVVLASARPGAGTVPPSVTSHHDPVMGLTSPAAVNGARSHSVKRSLRRSAILGYVGASVVGAVSGVRGGRRGRPFGLSLPGSTRAQAFTVGTATSAPPLAVAALVAAEWRGHRRIVRGLALVFVVGILSEPDTWPSLFQPLRDRRRAAGVFALVALPVAVLVLAGPDRA